MHLEVTITSKGQITLPARLRHRFNLKAGDKVEFFLDHEGRITMRPRNRSTAAFLDVLDPRQPDPRIGSDDEAIALAVEEKDARARRRKVKSK